MAPTTRVSNKDKHPGNILLPDSHLARKAAATKAAIDEVAQLLKQEMYEDAWQWEGEEATRPLTRSNAKITHPSGARACNQLSSSKQEQTAAADNGSSHKYKFMKREQREMVAEANKQYYLDIEEDEDEEKQELAQNGKRKERVVTYSTDDERPTPKKLKPISQPPVRGLQVEVLLPNWRAIVARDVPHSHLKQASKSHKSDSKEKKSLELEEASNVDYGSCGDEDVVADSEEDEEEESNFIGPNDSQCAPSNVSLLVPTNGLQRASVNTPQNSHSGNGAAGAQRNFGPLVSTQRKPMGALRPISKSQPRVPASSAQQPAKKPHTWFRIEDLPNGSQQRFREDLLPMWLDFVSTLENPWDVANHINVMQEIWNMVFTDIDHTVQKTNDPVYYLLVQRAINYRNAFSKRGETAVATYLNSLGLKDPEQIAKYISFLVPSVSDIRSDEETAECYPFMWQETKVIMDEDGRIEHMETKGAFCSQPISDTLALYLEIRESIPQAWRQTDHPRGALVLATASVERALKMHSTGVYAKPQNHLESRFSQKHWGVTTENVMISVKKTSSRGWKKIIKAAMLYSRTRKTRRNLRPVPDRAREGPNGYTHCVDADSASDSGSDIIF
ncbi:hypothetical protein DEU56DRAFT_786747 [Suillus clintonianus]|uniref:uncharacterized protein n=1 Tax=Suillus clintonianus TaxID=1904413 RepID=UPI001B8846DA|nr:uncharacterized protein DEU56DRAFT_786747 [Suillus clintonianus]KAG2146831.1 hypothetical protein DEU56DRAFT_786747 [Suillus clintonianus]